MRAQHLAGSGPMRGLHSGPRPLSLKEPFLSACAHNVVGEARALLGLGAEVQSTAVLRGRRFSEESTPGDWWDIYYVEGVLKIDGLVF